jgi:glucose/arabinose dehydrogenase
VVRRGIGILWIGLLLTAALPGGAERAAAQEAKLTPFGGQTFNTPYHVAGVPGDPRHLFVVEGAGVVRLVEDGVTIPGPFLDIQADVIDRIEGGNPCECGLFSVAPAPDYVTSGLIYAFYTHDVPVGTHDLVIEEFRRSASDPRQADLSSRRIVMTIPHSHHTRHNGGQLQFGPDGFLYIWVGEGFDPSAAAQDLTTRLGKILRIEPRAAGAAPYTVPASNPFVDGPGGAADEIYASGLRNPWRGSFDRSTGDLTTGDVGRQAWEEIDYVPEGTGLGANFGWDCFEGTAVWTGCAVPNHTPPVHQYANPPDGTAAIAGGYVIRDPSLPSLAGRYVYADTSDALGGELHTIDLRAGSPSDRGLGLTASQVLSFGQDACGHIYVAAAGNGTVYRLDPVLGPLQCKLAPELALTSKGIRRLLKTGIASGSATCDEDCDLMASASITIRRPARPRSAGKKKPKPIRLGTIATRLQLGVSTELAYRLTRKQRRRVARAAKEGRKIKLRIAGTATGGGGGTDSAAAKSVRRKAKKK